MAKFVGIPTSTAQGKSPADLQMLNALKENVELLTGQRGSAVAGSSSLLRENILTSNPAAQKLTRVNARGAGVVISGASVPTLADYNKALVDLQTLAADLANLRTYVIQLTTAMRG